MTSFIPEEKINEIRAKASIVEVISDYVALKKSGRNYLGLCPFHSERTPSFTVNEEKGIFHSFGCGAGGNLFNFLMRAHQMSFPETVREVAKRYGIPLAERELSAEEKRRKTLRAQLLEVNEAAAAYYQEILLSQRTGEEGRNYLAGRGLSRELIQTHRLGFAPDAWDSLALYFQKKGVDLRMAENLGLLLPRKEAQGVGNRPSYYDRFRRRVIFPIQNEGGQVCGFGGRIIDHPSPQTLPSPPKYMNSPESPVYSKGHLLYGLPVAKGPIIVEGYMDLLSLHQEGILNVVASLGTSLTPVQVSLLGRFAGEAVLIFDADEGGKRATERSLELFLQERLAVKVASLPAGDDPDSFIRKERRSGFERLLEGALPLMEFLWQKASRRYPTGTVEGKVRVVRELIPALKRLSDPLERNLYIERIAHGLGMMESQIRSLLPGAGEDTYPKDASPCTGSREAPHERLLLQLMLKSSHFIPVVVKEMGAENFSIPRYQRLVRELLRLWEMKTDWEPQKFMGLLPEEEMRSLVAELLLTEESLIEPERMLKDCLRQWRLIGVRREIQRVDEEIRERSRAEAAGSSATTGLKELLKRKQRLIVEQKKWVDESAVGQGANAG